MSDICRFPSFEWEGTYEGVQNIINRIKNNDPCSDCPEMGIDASKMGKLGMFIVITGTERPYCSMLTFHYQRLWKNKKNK